MGNVYSGSYNEKIVVVEYNTDECARDCEAIGLKRVPEGSINFSTFTKRTGGLAPGITVWYEKPDWEAIRAREKREANEREAEIRRQFQAGLDDLRREQQRMTEEFHRQREAEERRREQEDEARRTQDREREERRRQQEVEEAVGRELQVAAERRELEHEAAARRVEETRLRVAAEVANGYQSVETAVADARGTFERLAVSEAESARRIEEARRRRSEALRHIERERQGRLQEETRAQDQTPMSLSVDEELEAALTLLDAYGAVAGARAEEEHWERVEESEALTLAMAQRELVQQQVQW